MTASPHAERFRSLNAEGLPDVHTLAEDRERILWVLAVADGDGVIGWLSASEIADILRDCAGIHVPRQRAVGILGKEKGTIAPTKIDGKVFYKIMKLGRDVVANSASSSAIFVDPEKAFSNVRAVEEILGSLRGELLYCDPYVDRRTLDFLSQCTSQCTIKLLAVNIQGSATFAADLKMFEKEFPKCLEVRQLGQGQLHDRYIVHRDGILILGSSLKDIGKKQSFVVSLGKEISAAVAKSFLVHWNNAKQIV